MYPLVKRQSKLFEEFLANHLANEYTIYVYQIHPMYHLFFIKKKDDKQRPVQDYCKLNEIIICNTYPLPLIKDLIQSLVKKKWFTKFDIHWGYNNMHIKDDDQWKATFKTNKGLFKPIVMFFGLTNSLTTFQTMMDAIFCNEIVLGDIIIYMDDILMDTKGSLEYHKAKVAHILQKLKNNDLFLKSEKCQFHKEVEYLDVIIGKGQVKMDTIKVQGITDWPVPTNLHKLQYTHF
jgi:hypothetical protein